MWLKIIPFGSGDCTNGGVSSRVSRLRVRRLSIREHSPASTQRVILEAGPEGDVDLVYREQYRDWIALPVQPVPRGRCGWMFGGNVATPDGGFDSVTAALPSGVEPPGDNIRIHDRCE